MIGDVANTVDLEKVNDVFHIPQGTLRVLFYDKHYVPLQVKDLPDFVGSFGLGGAQTISQTR